MRITRHLSLIVLALLVAAPLAASAGGAIRVGDDGRVDLEPLRGRVVVVDFWASWCVPCRKSLPWFSELRARHGGDGLTVISVGVDADPDAADRFRERYGGADLALLRDPEGRIASAYELDGMPSTFVYDRTGALAFSHVGFRDRDRTVFEHRIAALLQREVGSR